MSGKFESPGKIKCQKVKFLTQISTSYAWGNDFSPISTFSEDQPKLGEVDPDQKKVHHWRLIWKVSDFAVDVDGKVVVEALG